MTQTGHELSRFDPLPIFGAVGPVSASSGCDRTFGPCVSSPNRNGLHGFPPQQLTQGFHDMRKLATIAGFALMLAANSASAQVSGNMTATATVGAALAVSAAPGVAGQIRFGTLAQGAGATTVLPSAASAGRFDVTGIAGTALAITFTSLPATLNGPAGATIPMTAYQACFTATTVNAGCAAQAITVGPAMTGGPALSGTGLGYVWIGATLGAIGGGQVVGTYTGTVTIQIVAL